MTHFVVFTHAERRRRRRKMADLVDLGVSVENVAYTSRVSENTVRSACREFDVTCQTAAERGIEISKMRLIDIPPLAMNFVIWMCVPGKTNYDDIDIALTIYAECVEGLSGDLATDEHRAWFINAGTAERFHERQKRKKVI